MDAFLIAALIVLSVGFGTISSAKQEKGRKS